MSATVTIPGDKHLSPQESDMLLLQPRKTQIGINSKSEILHVSNNNLTK